MQLKPSTNLILKKPPVVETALSIQFSDLAGWEAIHHGLFYPTIKDRFPKYRQRPLSPPLIMPFPLVPNIQTLQITRNVSAGRAEFCKDADTTLVAIQNNCFSFHWQLAEDGSYPSYAANRGECEHEFNSFVKFCCDQSIGEVKPVLCEAMYLNRIYAVAGESIGELCESVFSLSVPGVEALTLNRTFVLDDNRGRLYAEINTVTHEEPHIVFKLSSRVRHNDKFSAMETMDAAHDWLIRKFRELTSDLARKERWQQK